MTLSAELSSPERRADWNEDVEAAMEAGRKNWKLYLNISNKDTPVFGREGNAITLKLSNGRMESRERGDRQMRADFSHACGPMCTKKNRWSHTKNTGDLSVERAWTVIMQRRLEGHKQSRHLSPGQKLSRQHRMKGRSFGSRSWGVVGGQGLSACGMEWSCVASWLEARWAIWKLKSHIYPIRSVFFGSRLAEGRSREQDAMALTLENGKMESGGGSCAIAD